MAEVLNSKGIMPRRTREESANGIKFFLGRGLPSRQEAWDIVKTITPAQLREEKAVWRPEETVEAARPFFNQGRLMVVGGPQEGKGTILFGLSEICELIGQEGVGYVFINGHHQEIEAVKVEEAIRIANERNVPIFFDSFDYLALGSRQTGRTVSRAWQKERIARILPVLQASQVPIAITMHDDPWAELFLDKDLRGVLITATEDDPVYVIPRQMQSDSSVLRFLRDHGVGDNLGRFLTHLHEDENAFIVLNGNLGVQKAVIIREALRSYPVLKMLVRPKERNGMKERLTEVLGDNIKIDGDKIDIKNTTVETASLQKFANLILDVDKIRMYLAYFRRYKKLPEII